MKNCQILYQKESNHYRYEKIFDHGKVYFRKQIIQEDLGLKQQLQNEIEKFQLLSAYSFLPRIVNFDLQKGYIVYQNIEGYPLQKNGNFTIRDSLKILIQLADILQIIHHHQIVHCDIKLSNIMMDRHNKVWLLDFGCSHFLGERADYGSFKYCCPDQLLKYPVNVTFDIYAVGIIMYELLTKCEPYDISSIQKSLFQKQQQTLSITKKVLNLPPLADEILWKALGKAGGKNYIDIKSMRDDLITLLQLFG